MAAVTAFKHRVQLFELLDGIGNSGPVGQRAAEPAMVHVILSATASSFGNRLLSLTFGAHEQDPSTFCDRVAHKDQGLVQRGDGLGQVHDVDSRTITVDIRLHARIPAVGLVTEVNASFEQLTHVEVR